MSYIVLADPQDITRAGLMYLCERLSVDYQHAPDKTELIEQLKAHGDAVVLLDYTLFDINDIDELEILHERFPLTQWILFSFELSTDFVRRAITVSQQFSVLLKDSPLSEIRQCIQYALNRRFSVGEDQAQGQRPPEGVFARGHALVLVVADDLRESFRHDHGHGSGLVPAADLETDEVVGLEKQPKRGPLLQRSDPHSRSCGAFCALNLDGGGSTELIVNGKLYNSPSEGRERSISYGLGVREREED